MYGIYESGSIIARFVAPMSVRSNKPVFASDTLSLKRKISERTAQRWEIETRLEPLSSNAGDLFVELITKGHSTPTTIIVPQNYGAKLRLTSSSSPTATGALGSNVISISNNTGLIPKGTFIKFNNIPKVYLLISDITGNGNATVYPELRAAVSDTAFVYRDDVIMMCHYDLDTIIGMTYSDGILMDVGTIKMVESV
jgi:hypothetical protein